MAGLGGELLAVVLSVVAAVEFFIRSGFLKHASSLSSLASKTMAIVQSRKISEHWKERVLPVYAGRMMLRSLLILVLLAALVGVFYAVYWVVLSAIGRSDAVAASVVSWRVQILVVAFGIAYAWVRQRLVRPSH
jgi:hypothetical protein